MPALQTQVEEDVHPIMANAIDVANSIMELTKKGYPAGAIFYGIAIFLASAGWPVDVECDGGSGRGAGFDRLSQPGPGSVCRRQHRHCGSEFWANRGELIHDSLAYIQWQPEWVRRKQSRKLFQFASVLWRSKQLTVGNCCELGSPIPWVLGE